MRFLILLIVSNILSFPFSLASAQTVNLNEQCHTASFSNSDFKILSVSWESADDYNYCKIAAETERRVSEVDKQEYAIGFEMRLPSHWNQRFLFQGNGGNDGRIIPATGSSANHSVSALAKGFAVISTDAGHQSKSLLAGSSFGFDPQARINYGYRANQVLTPIAKKIINRFYGEQPKYSYFAGCSNGGRHAMVAASRLSNEFDGFLAGNPGFNLPKAAIQHAWDIQALSSLNMNITQSLTQETLDLLANRVVQVCDKIDGLEDGIIHALEQCQAAFKLDALQCNKDNTQPCLEQDTLEVIAKLFSGPSNSAGQQLYTTWVYDAGINAADWRRWKIHSPIANLPLIATLGAGSLANIFTTPPTAVTPSPENFVKYLRQFDFDQDAAKITAVTQQYHQSAMEFMTPPQAEILESLLKNNSKLIVYHGASDGVFSVQDTINWYQALDNNHHYQARDFAQLFIVPGMNHCAGGPATDQFDLLTALVEWVEEGKAPTSVIATVNSSNQELPEAWSPQRSRPLCSYPQVATYKSGNPEQASSFSCQ